MTSSAGAAVGFTYGAGHPLTLRDELLRIILCNNRFHHFIANGWQHTLLPVRAERLTSRGAATSIPEKSAVEDKEIENNNTCK